MSAEMELHGIIYPAVKPWGGTGLVGASSLAARDILDAGYSKPRTITTAEELDALPEGSAVLDASGDISTKHAHWWHGYETAPLMSRKLAKYGPLTVLYTPKES